MRLVQAAGITPITEINTQLALLRAYPRPVCFESQPLEKKEIPQALAITSPLPRATLLIRQGQRVPLEAAGGQRPLRWLVDGRPVALGQFGFNPAGGAQRLTVIDQAGQAAKTTITSVFR